ALFSALDGRLAPPAQALLHEVIAADDMNDEDSGWEQAQSCLRRLQEQIKKQRINELRRLARAAEHEGRIEEALRLNQELLSFERSVGVPKDERGGSVVH